VSRCLRFRRRTSVPAPRSRSPPTFEPLLRPWGRVS